MYIVFYTCIMQCSHSHYFSFLLIILCVGVALNTGPVLWLQQFSAMFLKRFYNSIRFWVSIIWQFILPIAFVLWAMVLAVTLPGLNSDEPPRVMTISSSSLSNNRTFFWAEFGDNDIDVCWELCDFVAVCFLYGSRFVNLFVDFLHYNAFHDSTCFKWTYKYMFVYLNNHMFCYYRNLSVTFLFLSASLPFGRCLTLII